MKILKTSILPVIGLLSLAAIGTAHGRRADAPAVQEYTNSNNFVVIQGNTTVGSLTGTTAYGLRFSGINYGASNGNLVENFSTIISGTGYGSVGTAGILFDAQNYGNSNGNQVINYGTILGLASYRNAYSGGILFNCANNGDTKNNLVVNYGSIQVSGSGGVLEASSRETGIAPVRDAGIGIGFVTSFTYSANNNTVINFGTINVSTTGRSGATGIFLSGENEGDSSNNAVINQGTIVVSNPQGTAAGIKLSGLYDGKSDNNTITNYGAILASGSNATGILLVGSQGGSVSNNEINNWGTISVSPGGTAIRIIDGNNNVINLGGHSTVNGLIAATGTHNVLRIAFTGISPEAAKALRAQLGAALNGTESSGTFVVRGMTFTYDPLIVELATSSYEKQGKTPNQKAIGANLDSFKSNPTGDMLKLLNALDQSGNVARGLEQLSPQRYQIYSDIALANANFFTQEIDRRLNNLRSGSESFDTTGLGVSASSAQSKLGLSDHKQVLGAARMSRDGKSVDLKDAVPESKQWGAFLSGDVIFANVDGRNWQQDSNFTTGGLLAGVDAKVTDALTAGLLLGYNHSDVDLDSQNSNANVDTYSTGAYAGYHEGNFYGNGLFTYSRNIYESDRNIDFPGISRTANGRTAGSQYVINLDGGYDHPVCKDLTVGPFAGLQYVNLGVNSFTENGAGAANLAINDQSVDSLRSRLGVRVELRKELTARWTAASELRFAWQHEFLNNDRAIVSRFSGSGLGAFSVRTDDPERDAALLGIGLNATYNETLTTFVDYDVQVGQSHYVEQILKGGFKWSF